ncbi:hypothetical protein D3C71_1944710 [compost metagenome]
MMKMVNSSGSPRNTVTNTVAERLNSGRLLSMHSARVNPSTTPKGKVDSASCKVNKAPESSAAPQPSGEKESSCRYSLMIRPIPIRAAWGYR